VLEHPPYLPDLAPCDLYLFPNIKSVLKQRSPFCVGRNCESKNGRDQRKCFEHWQHHMQLCVNSEGNYFEGDHSWFPEFVNYKELQAQSFFFVSDLLFILSLFRQSTSTCFSHICSPSPGGILDIYKNWYVLRFLVECLLARPTTSQLHLSFSSDMLYKERTFETLLGLTVSLSSGINVMCDSCTHTQAIL